MLFNVILERRAIAFKENLKSIEGNIINIFSEHDTHPNHPKPNERIESMANEEIDSFGIQTTDHSEKSRA